jgi:DNA-binding NarL/FixJ family response regulator
MSPTNLLTRLTKREREVVACLLLGLHNLEIARRLHVKPRTVERHLQTIYSKCQVDSRMSLVLAILEHPPEEPPEST